MSHPTGTYNHNLHHVMPDVLIALNKGRQLAFWMGDKDAVSKIEYAIHRIENCEIQYSDECVQGMQAIADECKRYGGD